MFSVRPRWRICLLSSDMVSKHISSKETHSELQNELLLDSPCLALRWLVTDCMSSLQCKLPSMFIGNLGLKG
jgi:hypothetical protein